MGNFLKVKDVAQILKVSPSAVRHYTNTNQLECSRTKNGQRVFTQENIDRYLGAAPEVKTAFYIRSSSGDEKLLDSQLSLLTEVYGQPLKIFKDKASGLNENRKGLKSLIEHAKKGEVTRVCVTAKDRLTRFGFTYLKDHLETLNVETLVLNEVSSKTIQEELMQDFMSLIASFSGKFYRLRGFEQQKRLLEKAKGNIDEKANN